MVTLVEVTLNQNEIRGLRLRRSEKTPYPRRKFNEKKSNHMNKDGWRGGNSAREAGAKDGHSGRVKRGLHVVREKGQDLGDRKKKLATQGASFRSIQGKTDVLWQEPHLLVTEIKNESLRDYKNSRMFENLGSAMVDFLREVDVVQDTILEKVKNEYLFIREKIEEGVKTCKVNQNCDIYVGIIGIQSRSRYTLCCTLK